MTLLTLMVDQRLDQQSTLEWTLPADDLKASLVVADAQVQFEDVMYYITEIDRKRNGTQAVVEVKACELWQRLAERKHIGTFTLDTYCAQGIDDILEAHGGGWTRGVRTETITDTTFFPYDGQDQTYLAMLRDWATICNKVIVWNTLDMQVDLVDKEDRGMDRGISFRYGRNLTSIEQHVEPPTVTRVYPYGRDDLNIASANSGVSYLEDYSFYTAQGISLETAQELYRKDEIYNNTDIVDQAALLAAGRAFLDERSQGVVEYKMSVVDLSEQLRVADGDITVGDRVRVKDDTLGFDVETTVVRLQRFPFAPWNNKVELAYLYDPTDPSGSGGGRAQSTLTWEMFQSRSSAYEMRENGTFLTNRIGLTFTGSAEAVYGVDVSFVGVGTGSLSVSAYEAGADELEHPVLSIPYTNGEIVQRAMTWSHDATDTLDALNGFKDYRVRMQAIPTGGGSSSASGVDIELFDSRMWILARGATKSLPTLPNSQRFEYTGSVQEFTVPDNVTEITIEVVGARGGEGFAARGGAGGGISGVTQVIPGTIYDVYVGQCPSPGSAGGWPDGGAGDNVSGGNGGGGGGSSQVRPDGGSLTSALLVGGGGGGTGDGIADMSGGDGGQTGGDGVGASAGAGTNGAKGGTQYAGGQGGFGAGFGGPYIQTGENGDTDATGEGGDAGNTTNSFAFPGGGGGGGWHGGGGGGTGESAGFYAGGGGGGSSHHSNLMYDVTYNDGVNGESRDHGYVVFSWETPEL